MMIISSAFTLSTHSSYSCRHGRSSAKELSLPCSCSFAVCAKLMWLASPIITFKRLRMQCLWTCTLAELMHVYRLAQLTMPIKKQSKLASGSNQTWLQQQIPKRTLRHAVQQPLLTPSQHPPQQPPLTPSQPAPQQPPLMPSQHSLQQQPQIPSQHPPQ